MKYFSLFSLCIIFSCFSTDERIEAFQEQDGVVVVEAESYVSQSETQVRKWHTINNENGQPALEDPDTLHYLTASNQTYLEILPDTRTTHADSLITGENFSNQPGKLGIVDYHVNFQNPGRYYVWVRTHSTGSEDNGIHVGVNGTWPESGQRMQWCEGKNQWTWASKQRTKEVHCGVEKLIYLDIVESGLHTISFSMREDGFEFDKWILSQEYVQPSGSGPLQSPTTLIKP